MTTSPRVWLGRTALVILLLVLLTDMLLTRTGLGIAVFIGYTYGHYFGGTFVFLLFWCVFAGLAPVLLPNLVYRWTEGWPASVRFLLSLFTLGVILAYMYFLYNRTAIGPGAQG